MSDSKVFMIPDGVTNGSQVDPNLLLTSMMNNNGFGGNGNWMWIIFLFFLYGWRGNGLFGGNNGSGFDGSALSTGYLSNQITNGTGRELLMQAINGNGSAIANLATTLNSDINSIKGAINSVQGAINTVGNQVGMSTNAVTNAINTGNMQLAQQLAQCCCDNKLLVTTLGYENQIATLNLTNALLSAINTNTVAQQEGFNALNFATANLTNNLLSALSNSVQSLRDATNAQTNSIMSKLDAIEDSRKDREIQELTAKLTAATAKAERQQELDPIIKQLSEIQCKQPSTCSVLYSPFTAVPNSVLWNAGLYGLNNLNGTGSIWS